MIEKIFLDENIVNKKRIRTKFSQEQVFRSLKKFILF